VSKLLNWILDGGSVHGHFKAKRKPIPVVIIGSAAWINTSVMKGLLEKTPKL
jgi:hypothetical protein